MEASCIIPLSRWTCLDPDVLPVAYRDEAGPDAVLQDVEIGGSSSSLVFRESPRSDVSVRMVLDPRNLGSGLLSSCLDRERWPEAARAQARHEGFAMMEATGGRDALDLNLALTRAGRAVLRAGGPNAPTMFWMHGLLTLPSDRFLQVTRESTRAAPPVEAWVHFMWEQDNVADWGHRSVEPRFRRAGRPDEAALQTHGLWAFGLPEIVMEWTLCEPGDLVAAAVANAREQVASGVQQQIGRVNGCQPP